MTNHSHVNAKIGYFWEKNDFWGRKYPSEVRVEHQTCNTICGTPVPAILNHKNSTGFAGGTSEGQNASVHMAH